MKKIIIVLITMLLPLMSLAEDTNDIEIEFNGGLRSSDGGFLGESSQSNSNFLKGSSKKKKNSKLKHHVYLGIAVIAGTTDTPFIQFGYDLQFLGNWSIGIFGLLSSNLSEAERSSFAGTYGYGGGLMAHYYYLNFKDYFHMASGITVGYLDVRSDNGSSTESRGKAYFGIDLFTVQLGFKFIFLDLAFTIMIHDNLNNNEMPYLIFRIGARGVF